MERFSYKGVCGVCGHTCIKVFKRRATVAWAIDKWLWINGIIKCYSYIVKKLKNEDVLNLKQYCMHCYVILSSIF